MDTYIVLLRAVNVSGSNIIKMTDLRSALEIPEFSQVKTYIQSGNIVLNSSLDSGSVEQRIFDIIKSSFGHDVKMIILSPDFILSSIDKVPFPKESNPSRVLLTFYSSEVSNSQLEPLHKFKSEEEEVIQGQRVLYCHFPNGSGKSKLTTKVIEKALDQPATSRNLRTMNKLIELAR